jgi:4-hydroxy-tetrahydrodipicolinate reductase
LATAPERGYILLIEKMRIALIGYGKMGREVEAAAKAQGETIACIFDSKNPVNPAALAEVDVCIEFSRPGAALANILTAVEAKKDIVVGTTGWQEALPQIQEKLTDSALLHSANFSLGMNIFQRIVARAAELMQNAPDYDPFIHEAHHRQKPDSPSGTAVTLANIVLERIGRKNHSLTETAHDRIDPAALHITSTRAGHITGTHTVAFDSEADMIELRHVAKNRRGFALGALVAARWLRGRKGIYTMDDVHL